MIGAEHRNPRRRGRSRLPRLVALALCLAGLLAPAWSAPAPAAAAQARGVGNPVLDWNPIAQEAIAVGRPPASSQVLAAIVQVAVYDTVIAIGGGARPYAAHPKPTRPASVAAAVATAAHHVLVTRVPGQAAGVDTRYADYLAAIPDGPAKANGIALGAHVAAAILALRAGDGFDNQVPWVQPAPGPGVFEPVAPTPPVDVALAQVRPLTFGSPSRFRPGGPTRLASHAYARDLAEVQALGRADSTVRSPAQTEVARFWSENTFVQWGRNLSAHGCWTTALVHTLGVFFGTDRVRLTVDSTVTGTSRHYRSLREVVREVRLARIAGGLHFRHSMGDGEHLGRRVARHVTRHHFQRR